MAMERAGVIALILITLLVKNGLAAEKTLHGEVLDIDRQAMTVTVRADVEGTGEVIQAVVLADSILVEKQTGEKRLPGCIQTGNHIRIRGRTSSGESGSMFLAEEVRGCGGSGCSDPTGVRQRLNKSRKRNCCR